MTTTLRNAWIAPQPAHARRIYATVKQDGRRGVVWDGTPLAVQVARDAIVVVFGDGKPAQYFQKHEIEIEER